MILAGGDSLLEAAFRPASRRVIHPTTGGVLIDVRVIPRAGMSGLAGTRGAALLVRLTAPPVEGAANAELIDVIAQGLGVAKRAVTIVSGERSRQKRVRVDGVSVAVASARLRVNGAGGGGNG
jgi:uncharacterized protein